MAKAAAGPFARPAPAREAIPIIGVRAAHARAASQTEDALLKFQPDTLDGVNNITRYDVDNLRVNADLHTKSVLVPWVGRALDWDASRVEDLTQAHFDAILEFDPEVVIFGSGPKLKFVSPALYRGLIARRIGVETMDSGAACRTYTVLANEGRRVVAAILLTPGA
jgi:uncharacterized protein